MNAEGAFVDYHALTERLERLYTPRLALRQVSLADGWPLFAASRNPQFNQYLLWDQPADQWPALDRVDAISQAARQGKLTAVSAVERETGAWVSLFRFQPFGNVARCVEMGVWTHHAYWHGTYTFELVSACIDAVFSFTEVDQLIAAASPPHERSIRLLNRLGLTRRGPIVRRLSDGGQMTDFYEHWMTRDEWQSGVDRRRFSVVEPHGLRAPATPIEVGAGFSQRHGGVAQAHLSPVKGITLEPLTLDVHAGVEQTAGTKPLSRTRPVSSAQVATDSQGD